MKSIWAIEPFHQSISNTRAMFKLIAALTGKPSSIEACFVVTGGEYDLNGAFDVPLAKRFTVYPRDTLRRLFLKSRVAIPASRIHILQCPTLSNSKAVKCLLTFAKLQGASLIALSTHGRKGFERFMIGSFAEDVIHISPVDLLLTNPTTRHSPSIERILYASDFSSAAADDLDRVIGLAKSLGASLTVFHSAEISFEWSLDEASPAVHAYRKKVRRTIKAIEQQCADAEIDCSVIVATELKPIVTLLLKQIEKSSADLVVVSAKAGPLVSLMGGSITRQIIRTSDKPILVLK